MILLRIHRIKSLIVLALILTLSANGGTAWSQKDVTAYIQRFALSHKGRYVAAKSMLAVDGADEQRAFIFLYDLQNVLSPPRFIAETHRHTSFIIFSPNDEYLAVGWYREVRVFRLGDGRELLNQARFWTMVPILTASRLILPSFSPDSRYIQFLNFHSDDERVLEIWQVDTGEQVKVVPAGAFRDSGKSLLMSPDWRQGVAAWGDAPVAALAFSIEDGIGETVGALSDEAGTVGDAFSDDGSLFAHATWGGGVEVYDTVTWALLKRRQLHETPCGDLGVSFTFSNTGSRLASTCQNESRITVWDFVKDKIEFMTVSRALRLQYSSDDTYLVGNPVSYGKNMSGIAVWNTRQNYEMTVYPGAASTVHPAKDLMLALGADGNIRIWNIELAQLQLILPTPGGRAAIWSG